MRDNCMGLVESLETNQHHQQRSEKRAILDTVGEFPSITQRTTTYVSRTAAVARAAMRTRCLRSQIPCIRCQSAAPSATRMASGTKTKIDATEIRTQIAYAVSRIARPGVCQQSQVWIPRNRVE